MKSRPVEPAKIEFGDVPAAPDFGDLYHPRVGAFEQARHVFLRGNGLPQRWAGRERFTILETGFGLGNNFLATWQAWRDDPARCRRLHYVAIERHPPRRADLERAHRASPAPEQAQALLQAWPPLTPDLHRIEFEGAALTLLLAFGDVADWLPELRLAADAVYLDGFAPARNPAMWTAPVLKAIGRRAAPGATAATWSVARELREGLAGAGFEPERAPGIGGKREITVARFAPRFPLPAALPPSPAGTVLVVGAGLAGAAVAEALALAGREVTVVDRHPGPAAEASGQPGGLFHGTVHADDGPHARLLRSAALWAARAIAPRVAAGLAGQTSGLLRLAGRDLAAMRGWVDRQRLPDDWVQALDGAAASALAGVALPGPAWFFPGGGWVAAPALVADLLARPAIRLLLRREVARLQPTARGWQALDRDGTVVAETAAVVVAGAADAAALLVPFGLSLPIRRWRGQTSGWSGAATALRRPVAGNGYALPGPSGGLLCGATHQADDGQAELRDADHQLNFGRLQRLTGLLPPADPALWSGRVGWRAQVADRMPVAGPLPGTEAPLRAGQARDWPRVEGLYTITALGGRGITLAPLLGRLVAAQIAGEPWALERGLVDAVDPVRWRLRAVRGQAER